MTNPMKFCVACKMVEKFEASGRTLPDEVWVNGMVLGAVFAVSGTYQQAVKSLCGKHVRQVRKSEAVVKAAVADMAVMDDVSEES